MDSYILATSMMNEHHTKRYSGSLWWYQDGRYFNDGVDAPLFKQKIYERSEGQQSKFVDEVLKQVIIRSEIVKDGTTFPIRFRNGVLDKGKFLTDTDPLQFTPYYIPVEYHRDVKPCPFVEDYINELTSGDEDYKNLLGEVLGYAFITDPGMIRALGKFFIFRGDGGNGKGTLLQIMKTMYGEQNCCSMSPDELKDDRYKSTLIGKLANLGDDIEPETFTTGQLKAMKNISTADTVTTRRLYHEAISVTFTAKLYFASNSDNKSFEKGRAFQRRIVWLPMFNEVKKPDPNFISKATTPEALEYWVSYAVNGYFRLYERQEWSRSELVDEYNKAYHERNNPTAEFANDVKPDDIVDKTVKQVEDMFDSSGYEGTFSGKVFKEAVWDKWEIGIGVKRVTDEYSDYSTVRRVFMRQSDTTQALKH